MGKASKYPIKHWSYSSLMSYLRNPLAWHKRYVELIYDTPSMPSGVIGRSGHVALQHFYSGLSKEAGVALGLEYLRSVDDSEIDFGKAVSARARKEKRASMEADYLQAVGFYLARAPRYKKIYGIETGTVTEVEGLVLPIKAISDLVVESKGHPSGVDIVDHKFVDSFSSDKAEKPLFILQAIFNYYTVKAQYGREPHRFILQECKKRKNKDGKGQLRRYAIEYKDCRDEFVLFHRLVNEASEEIAVRTTFLPNPSDMFEGKNSFDIYRLGL